ncbi:hypothetical protein M0Q50_03805 [bacterium]|jgi:hypothetical protein|nr:hypothetical protein [bacterium]
MIKLCTYRNVEIYVDKYQHIDNLFFGIFENTKKEYIICNDIFSNDIGKICLVIDRKKKLETL